MGDKKLSDIVLAPFNLTVGDYLVGVAAGNIDQKFSLAQIMVSIVRANIPTITIGVSTVVLAGFYVSGDLGAGAIYTSVGASSGGPMAIQDASGTWFNLITDNGTNVGYWGAKGDGTTDDSTTIQAAINFMSNASNPHVGGIIEFPRGRTFKCNLVPKSYVALAGSGKNVFLTEAETANFGTILTTADPNNFIINSQASGVTDFGVSGMRLEGAGTAGTNGGIFINVPSYHVEIKECQFNNFGEQAIWFVGGGDNLGHTVHDCTMGNCLLNRTRVAQVGVLQMAGTDSFFSNLEVTASTSIEGHLISANQYIAAIYIAGTENMLNACIGEISDAGIVISGQQNRLVNCRADTNYGNGFILLSSTVTGNMLSNCEAFNNSRNGSGTYSGFYVSAGTPVRNMFTGCFAFCSSGSHLYGFEDRSNTESDQTQRNAYVGCRSRGDASGIFFSSATAGSQPGFISSDYLSWGAGSGAVLIDTETHGSAWVLSPGVNSTWGTFGFIDGTNNKTDYVINYANDGGFQLRSGSPFTWSSDANFANGAAADTGLSRLAAGKLGIGNGTAGDASGVFVANILTSNSLYTSKPNVQTGTTYTVDSGAAQDYSITVNATATCTVTLPTPSTVSGRWLVIKTVAAQTVISNASNVRPQNSQTAAAAILAAGAGNWAALQSDATDWVIMMSGT